MKFNAFLGIDQTGAAIKGGREARPLPAALVLRRGPAWELTTHRLKSVTPTEIGKLSPSLPSDLSDLAILVDCVLGLPVTGMRPRSKGRFSLRDFMHEVRSESGFGRDIAHQFFTRLQERHYTGIWGTRPPIRRVEEVSGSNSVFTYMPFQRNVQTGTYRIWHDIMSPDEPDRWCEFWPSETSGELGSHRPVIFEGYPTLFWKKIIGQKARRPSELPLLLKKIVPEIRVSPACRSLILKDPDIADAAVLAVGAYVMESRARASRRAKTSDWSGLLAPPPEPVHPIEGWIVGLDSKDGEVSSPA